VQATYYKLANEFIDLSKCQAVACSGSNYAIPGQILQGVNRFPSVKRHAPIGVVEPTVTHCLTSAEALIAANSHSISKKSAHGNAIKRGKANA
jgi:hypothetical protein